MSVRLLTGDDSILISEAVSRAVQEFLGTEDRALALQQLGEEDLRSPDGGWSLAALIDAAQTPPFLTARRVVVGRHLARFARGRESDVLIRLLNDPPPTTDLVLVWERGQDPAMTGRMPAVPKRLSKAVQAAGGTVLDVTPPTRKGEARQWLKDQLTHADLRFEPAAVEAIGDLVGTDSGNVVGLLRTLEGALGPKARVTVEDVEMYGGQAGAVVPWELDDAIDRGDIAEALRVLHRLLPSRHSLVVLATLHGRYQRMLRLDGAGIADERQAAEVLGMRGSTFPARKLLGQTRKLGPDGVARAIGLLAEADMALRGTLDWSDELVMEVLVARLASLSSR